MNYQKLLDRLQQGFSTDLPVEQANKVAVACFNALSALLEENEQLRATQYKQRTEKQSSSRWVYLEQMAQAMNEAGIDRNAVIEMLSKNPAIDAQNTKETLYHDMWHRIHKALYPEVKRLNTEQIQHVYESMNNHCALVFGIGFPWPSEMELMNK